MSSNGDTVKGEVASDGPSGTEDVASVMVTGGAVCEDVVTGSSIVGVVVVTTGVVSTVGGVVPDVGNVLW